MKKWMITAVLTAIVWLLAMPVLADEGKMTLSDAQAQQGQTVYLTVSINEAVTGDSVGISFSYDAALLTAAPSRCSWSRSGILEDFGTRRDSGVWASDTAQALQGELCVLAFELKPEALLVETSVSCTVIVKQGDQAVAEYTAEATVTAACTHSFGDWQDSGALGHSHSCTHCGAAQTQSHSWDGGVITAHPENASLQLQTFTCTVCGARKSQEIRQEQVPTLPVITGPTQPRPTLSTVPAEPGMTLPGGPGNYTPVTLPQGSTAHDHTHSGEGHPDPDEPASPAGLIAVLLLAAVMIGGALWFIRKKH